MKISSDQIELNFAMEEGGASNFDGADASFLPIEHSLESVSSLEIGTKKMPGKNIIPAGIESDSLNENFSPIRPNTKKKRRFKRMALDPETNPPATKSNITGKGAVGHTTSTTGEDLQIPKNVSSHNDPHTASADDPTSSNTGTIKRKKVRSRSAGGTNQLPQIRQNVKRVYHGAHSLVAHSSSTNVHCNSSSSSSKVFTGPPSSSLSPSITIAVVPGKRKRSSNREKSVENTDISSQLHSYTYYRSRPTSNPETVPDIIFENDLASNINPRKLGNILASNKIVNLDKTDNPHAKKVDISTKLKCDSMVMDCDDEDAENHRAASSSSLSSSDWASDDELIQDGGQTGQVRVDGNPFVTTIESDHEADDEQSDWPGQEDADEIRGDYHKRMNGETVFGLTDDELDNAMLDDPNSTTTPRLMYKGKGEYHHILDNDTKLTGSGDDKMDLNILSSTARQTYMARMKRLAECVPGREIRAGSRRVRSRQRGFTIKSSSSEQVSRFLQDGSRSELRLTVLRSADRNKIAHLANLYSLSMRYEDAQGARGGVLGSASGGNMLVLTKTGRTLKVDQSPFVVPSSSSGGNISGGLAGSHKTHVEVKRRRKSGPLQSSIDSLSMLNLLPSDESSHLQITGGVGGSTSVPDAPSNVNDRIERMLDTSFNPSAVCLSSSMVAHQGSLPCTGVDIELNECQETDDRPAKSSSTSEENEEESPLSSPNMKMVNIQPEIPSPSAMEDIVNER